MTRRASRPSSCRRSRPSCRCSCRPRCCRARSRSARRECRARSSSARRSAASSTSAARSPCTPSARRCSRSPRSASRGVRYEHAPRGPQAFSLDTLLAGVRFVRQRQVVLGAISLDLFAVLLGGATALLPIFAKDILHVGPWGLGLLRAAPAVGALAMSLALTRWPIDRHAGRVHARRRRGLRRRDAGVRPVDARSGCRWRRSPSRAPPTWSASSCARRWCSSRRPTRCAAASVPSTRCSSARRNQLGEFESGATAALLGPVGSVVLGGARVGRDRRAVGQAVPGARHARSPRAAAPRRARPRRDRARRRAPASSRSNRAGCRRCRAGRARCTTACGSACARESPDALVVHRLDMATSGLMLFARGADAQRALEQAFAQRERSTSAMSRSCRPRRRRRGEIDLPLSADWPNRPLQKVDAAHRQTVADTLPRARLDGAPTHPPRTRTASPAAPTSCVCTCSRSATRSSATRCTPMPRAQAAAPPAAAARQRTRLRASARRAACHVRACGSVLTRKPASAPSSAPAAHDP